MAERKKKKDDDQGGGAPAWMVTYGDLMSLLLTFFVLLLSFSTISEKDFKEAVMSLKGALGVMPRSISVVDPRMPNQRMPRMPKTSERVAQELARRVQMQGLEDEVEIDFDFEQGGVHINLPGEVLFGPGSATLRPEALPLLSSVTEVLGAVPDAFMEVRGHTDASPVQAGAFSDNYELSFFRAKAVMDYMRSDPAMGLARFESIACGSDQPIATNETAEGRARNRRVEIFVRGRFEEGALNELDDRMNTILPQQEQERPVGLDVDFGDNGRFVR
jgi:chemotaxis protein MotB